jgi:thymidylate synthase
MIQVVTGNTLPEVWEESILRVYQQGARVPTQYDAPDDPLSWDVPMVMEVLNPLQQPKFHRGIIGGIEDLEKYRMEVVEGLFTQPSTKDWPYTYYDRLFKYPWTGPRGDIYSIDQIGLMIDHLCECVYTRRAQAITWVVSNDADSEHPACLQRIWTRIVDNALEMHVHFRSNDALKAAFFNMYAFMDLQEKITDTVNLHTGREIEVGPYRHFADSYHIYGRDEEALQRFLKLWEDRPDFTDRTWTFAQVRDLIKETREKYRPAGFKSVWAKYWQEAMI